MVTFYLMDRRSGPSSSRSMKSMALSGDCTGNAMDFERAILSSA